MTTDRASRHDVRVRPATTGDRPAVVDLLNAAGLPAAGLSPTLEGFLIAEREGRPVGAIGLETYGQDALLRSAVVEPASRGTGVGAALVDRLLQRADERKVRAVYLLTTTAERWFPRFGFQPIGRDEVADGVRGSVEFREACPASATVMRRVAEGGLG